MWYHSTDSLAADVYHLYALVLQVIEGRSIFYYNPDGLECSWRWFQQWNLSSYPQWVWHSQTPFALLKAKHNSELFVMVCLAEDYKLTELKGLSATLRHLRSARVLIELANGNSSNEESVATHILTHCLESSMLNVVLYFQCRTDLLTVYSFEAFPYFSLLKNRFIQSNFTGRGGQLFPNQMDNLEGYPLKVMPDFSEPNTIQYIDNSGQSRITGFMWHFMETFAERLNANLSAFYPTWQSGRVLAEQHMLEFTKNGTIDFGLVTAQTSKKNLARIHQYSYPILYGSWCIMLPLERPIEREAVFGRVLEAKALTLLLAFFGCFFLLKMTGVGVTDFPIWISYCWYCFCLTPRLLAIAVLSICVAQLFTLMIVCPQLSLIDSFESLIASDLRIFGMRAEFDWLDDDFRAKYAEAFRLTTDINDFFRLRNNFNTSWAYSIPTTKWLIMVELQRHFQRPLFRYSELCLYKSTSNGLLLAEESLYYEALKLFTMRTRQSGLLQHWMQHSLYDMVRAGRMHFKDYSTPIQKFPLNLQDFHYAWWCCGVGILLALIVFVVEVLRFYVDVCLDSL